jgi:hypothetical protein
MFSVAETQFVGRDGGLRRHTTTIVEKRYISVTTHTETSLLHTAYSDNLYSLHSVYEAIHTSSHTESRNCMEY